MKSINRIASLLAFICLFLARRLSAQEAVHEMLNNEFNANSFEQAQNQQHTFKIKDLRVLVSPSFELDYNDNIGLSEKNPRADFILRPQVNVTGVYPLTDNNVLTLNVGVGYDEYIRNPHYSGLTLSSGSGLGFDMEIGDFRINLHDRFTYSQDAAREAAIAGSGAYGVVNNLAGIGATWDLGDVRLSLGYDHKNTTSTSRTSPIFQSQDHSSELIVARSGFRIHPQLTVGLEGTGSFTAYDKRILNDNTACTLGAFADWQQGSLHLAPRIGYTIFDFQHTSSSIQTGGANSWYSDLTASCEITEAISASLSGGHEVRLGIESDAIETWYFRPALSWKIIEGGVLGLGLSYENGKQGFENKSGNLAETYNYYGSDLSFRYALTKKCSVGMNYRLTLRSSTAADRSYNQNLVGLQITYLFQ